MPALVKVSSCTVADSWLHSLHEEGNFDTSSKYMLPIGVSSIASMFAVESEHAGTYMCSTYYMVFPHNRVFRSAFLLFIG